MESTAINPYDEAINAFLLKLKGYQGTAVNIFELITKTETSNRNEERIVFEIMLETMRALNKTFNGFCETHGFLNLESDEFEKKDKSKELEQRQNEKVDQFIDKLEGILSKTQLSKLADGAQNSSKFSTIQSNQNHPKQLDLNRPAEVTMDLRTKEKEDW